MAKRQRRGRSKDLPNTAPRPVDELHSGIAITSGPGNSPSIAQCSQDYVWDEMRVIPGEIDLKDHLRTMCAARSRNTLLGVKGEEVLIMQLPGYPISLTYKQATQLSQWLKKVL